SFLVPSTQAQEPAPVPTPPPATKEPAANSQQPAKPKPDNASEISQTETPATFKVLVNLAQARAIVRDPSGKTIDNRTRRGVVLYDQGKPQFITNFSVETPETRLERATAAKPADDSSRSEDGVAVKAPVLPERFVAVVFDALRLSLEDVTF